MTVCRLIDARYQVMRGNRHIGTVSAVVRGRARIVSVTASSDCDCKEPVVEDIASGSVDDAHAFIAQHWETHHPATTVASPSADSDVADSWGGPVGVGFKGDIAQAVDP